MMRCSRCAHAGGSSPLARGTHRRGATADFPHGLIPARAGNTGLACVSRTRRRAHPRSRGEHIITIPNQVGVKGSSPLARGTLTALRSFAQKLGLIPARAGNTSRPHSHTERWRAHPRSRGEHSTNGQAIPGVEGSSPLARGTHRRQSGNDGTQGLIPARAGNTLMTTMS